MVWGLRFFLRNVYEVLDCEGGIPKIIYRYRTKKGQLCDQKQAQAGDHDDNMTFKEVWLFFSAGQTVWLKGHKAITFPALRTAESQFNI